MKVLAGHFGPRVERPCYSIILKNFSPKCSDGIAMSLTSTDKVLNQAQAGPAPRKGAPPPWKNFRAPKQNQLYIRAYYIGVYCFVNSAKIGTDLLHAW